jgi:hypothetical protein
MTRYTTILVLNLNVSVTLCITVLVLNLNVSSTLYITILVLNLNASVTRCITILVLNLNVLMTRCITILVLNFNVSVTRCITILVLAVWPCCSPCVCSSASHSDCHSSSPILVIWEAGFLRVPPFPLPIIPPTAPHSTSRAVQ